MQPARKITTHLIIFFFLLELFSCRSDADAFHQVNPTTRIVVQPYKGLQVKYADTVLNALKKMYHVHGEVMNQIELPIAAYVTIKSPRYRADSLIRFLKNNDFYGDIDFVIGLTASDISTTKYSNWKEKKIKEPLYKYKDWGIFGLGYCPGKSCIVSTYRLQKGTSKENFIARLKKVSCHEIGHNFGLPHCPNKSCIMQDAAETITTIDNVALNLCDDCRMKIGLD